MGRPAEAVDLLASTHEMVPESDLQSVHEVNPDTIGPTIEITPATYNSQHGQEVHQESNQPHPTKMPGNSPHPSSQPKDNPINHHQQQQFQFQLHQQGSPSPSNQASHQQRDAPAQPQPPQAPPVNYPPQSQPTKAASYPPKAQPANYPHDSETPHVSNYPPEAQPANYPPESETPHVANYPPKAPPAPQAASYPPKAPPANYPPQTGPASYPPQSQTEPENYPPQPNPQMYQNSYQQQQQQQQQPQPVQFPPQPSNPNATVYPQQAMPQAYPETFPSHNKPGVHQNVSTAPGIPVPQTYPQPAGGAYGINAGTEAWTTGLFDLMEDPQNALITFFFPCVTFGQIAEIIDNGHTSCGTSGMFYGAIGFLIGVPCLMSCTYRTKLRSKYDLVEAPAPDWLTHFLCECCALSQEYRELRNRGFDPALGWIGNLSRNHNLQQQQQIHMVPPMNQTMMG